VQKPDIIATKEEIANNSGKQELLLSKKDNNATSTSSYEIVDISFSVCIDFYLTNDPLMAFLKYRKEGMNPVFHLLSSEITDEAYMQDINYADFQMRSSLLHILSNAGKNVKHPIIFNGITYMPSLFFFRNSNFKLLNYPICTPGMLVQIFPDDIDQQDKITMRNNEIIAEAFEISDIFGHDSVIVNLLKINEAWFLIRTLMAYVESFAKKSYCSMKNLVFITNLDYDSFCSVLAHPRINETFEKYKLKYRVFSD